MTSSNSQNRPEKNNNTGAKKLHALEEVLRDLESLSPIFKNKQFKELLDKISFASNKTKLKLIESTFPDNKFDNMTLDLLMLVSKIYELYQSSYNNKKDGDADIVVRLAKMLGKEEEKVLTTLIREKRGADVEIRFEYDPDLIGGMQIYEKDSFADYSLQNSLRILGKKLKM